MKTTVSQRVNEGDPAWNGMGGEATAKDLIPPQGKHLHCYGDDWAALVKYQRKPSAAALKKLLGVDNVEVVE